jgi:hypothetical protein
MFDRLPLPTFVVIGAQKSATRWLRTNLAEHPEVFMADREIAFFSNKRRFDELGLDWYRTQFEGWSGEPVVGEGTPAYMMLRHHPQAVSQRIDDSLADARVIAILRNPIDRALSAVVHHIQRERLPENTRLADIVRATPPEDDFLAIVAGGWYARSLQPYAERFDDRLLVLLHDDLSIQPERLYEDAVAHVGATAGFRPSGLQRVVYSNRRSSSELPTITDEDRLAVWPYFRDDVRALETLIDRDLSRWDPTVGGSTAASAASSASTP